MEKELTNKTSLQMQQSWYQKLLTDLKKLEFTGIVLTKWNIGNRILKDFEKFGRPKYGNKRVENVAVDLNIEKREIYRCIQFAEQCHAVTQFQNLSWREVVNKLLPEPRKEINIPELPDGKYQVILADPPWFYSQEQHSFKKEQATTLETHYPPMKIENICKLPIKELGLDNSVLFLWTTSPKLYEAKQVIDAWGYEYKASMIWDKVKHNVGYYVSVRHEFLLICTRGSCLPDNPKLHDSVVTQERTKHSKKPEIFYDIIEDIYKGKKIELFARGKPRKGWTFWGNQTQ